MAEETSNPSLKRPPPDSTTYSIRKVRRKLHHVQTRPQHVESAPQDAVFVQGQLLKSISAALTIAGFDSVTPTALEMFRSHVEEYMVNFLDDVRTSMHTFRRTRATAQDFTSALAFTSSTSSASFLTSQIRLSVPEQVTSPSIPEPDSQPPAPLDFSALLAPLVDVQVPSYIPQHFPKLPPKHAWRHTDVYPERERDARRMREKATEEGIMAEQALRKLAAAAKAGAAKAERRRLDTLSGTGRKVHDTGKGDKRKRAAGRGVPASEDMFGEMMKEVAGSIDLDEDQAMALGADGVNDLREHGMDVGMPEGVVVNSDMAAWRRGGRRGLRA